MKSLFFLALFFCLGMSAYQNSENEYNQKKEECNAKKERVFKLKGYLTCIK